MLRKLLFLFHIYYYRIMGVMGLKRNDIMVKINEYYGDSFRKLDRKDVAVILPHCLISDRCPARFSKQDGILCSNCNLCGCGKIHQAAKNRGYGFYISASVGFTKRLIQRKRLKGIIGVACDYEIDKGIATERMSNNGIHIQGTRVKTQGVRLHGYDCIHNSVDWDKIEDLL